jgi:acyl-CoA dehydrogenase
MNGTALATPSRAVALAQELQSVLRDRAAGVDHDAAFPVASVADLRASGLMGLLVPGKYGGLGGDLEDLTAVAQTLAAGCLSTAMIWAMHTQQVDSLVGFAAPDLAARVLPAIASGDVLLASVTTEPATGAQLTAAATPLTGAGESLRFERVAPVVTGGQYADAFLITMRDSEDEPQNRVTLIYAERAQVRCTDTTEWDAMGMRGTYSVGMRMAGQVPESQVVGGRGTYRTVAVESMIPLAHLAWAACWLGAARSAYADVVALIRSRKRPGSLDIGSDLVAERLARTRIDLELVSAYLGKVTEEVARYRTIGRSLDTPDLQIHLNTLKVVAAESTFRAVDRLVRLAGLATGYLRSSDIPLERHFRDLRSASLNFADDRLLKAIGALAVMDRSVRLI